MARSNEVSVNTHIEKVATNLKSIPELKPPEWATIVKTGHHKQRPPSQKDWWYMRAAAILRTSYNIGPIGVSKLRTKYGGKKNRGVAAEHQYKGSGSIARKILQQLEKAGLLIQVQKGVHKGRVPTGKGTALLNKCAREIDDKLYSIEVGKPKAKPKAEPKADKNG